MASCQLATSPFLVAKVAVVPVVKSFKVHHGQRV